MTHSTELGVSQASPVGVHDLIESFCREFRLLSKGEVRAAQDVFRERAHIFEKNEVIFISQRHKRVQDTTTVSSQQVLLISVFYLELPMMIALLTDQFLFCQTVYLLLQLEQPILTFSGCFPLSQTIFHLFRPFHLFRQKAAVPCVCTYQWYLRMCPVSRHPAVLKRGQRHFSRMLLVPRPTAPRLAGNFPVSVFQHFLLFSHFPFLASPPFWLLMSSSPQPCLALPTV